jgi:apolipoprotein N-acyltransferase
MPNIFIPPIKRPDAEKSKLDRPVSEASSKNAGGVLWQWLAVGMVAGLAAPGFDLWPLAWIAWIPIFFWLPATRTVSSAFWRGLTVGAGYHAVYLCWYWGLHPLTWIGFTPEQSLAVSGGAWLLAFGWGALFTGLTLAAARWISPHLNAVGRILVFPLLWWAGFQLFRHTDFGVPWALLEYTQVRLPAIRLLAAGLSQCPLGSWGGGGSWVAVLIIAHNVVWAEWFRQHPQGRLLSMATWIPATLGIALLLIGLTSVRDTTQPTQTRPVPITLVQGNLPIDVIRSADRSRSAAVSAYWQVLQQLPIEPGSLIILPEEGAMPDTLALDAPENSPSYRALATLAAQHQSPILAGTISQSDLPPRRPLYNTLILIPPQESQLPQLYHKRRLVPFGETTPYVDAQWLTATLQQLGVDYSTPFQPGEIHSVLSVQNQRLRIGGLVCFELIYPELAREYQEQGANMLVNVSNLGWFHGNRWLEQQFLAIGQMRAAETGLPLAISTNTGVSALIDGSGRFLQVSESQRAQILTGTLPVIP